MTTYFVSGDQLRQLAYGTTVTKSAVSLPQTATTTLYTVSGGRILVTSLVGQVSTVIGGTAVTVALGTAPTVGTAATGGIASATAVTSKEVGTFVSLNTSAGSALVVGGNAGASVNVNTNSALVVSAGTITWTTSATNTGQMQWYLAYLPIDAGATVS